MLAEIYIQALLVDEELADQVWDKGEIDDQVAWLAWCVLTIHASSVRRAKWKVE